MFCDYYYCKQFESEVKVILILQVFHFINIQFKVLRVYILIIIVGTKHVHLGDDYSFKCIIVFLQP